MIQVVDGGLRVARRLICTRSALRSCDTTTTLNRFAPQRPIGLRSVASKMKRKEPPSKAKTPTKKIKVEVPEYHLTPSIKEEDGGIQWPAPSSQMEQAREFIRACAMSEGKTLIASQIDG